jgi:hypothetical protein
VKLLCHLGFHRMMSHTTSELKGSEIVVYTWNFCERPFCRYSYPTLVEVERFKSKTKPYDQEG